MDILASGELLYVLANCVTDVCVVAHVFKIIAMTYLQIVCLNSSMKESTTDRDPTDLLCEAMSVRKLHKWVYCGSR